MLFIGRHTGLPGRARGRAEAEGAQLHPRRGLPGRRAEARSRSPWSRTGVPVVAVATQCHVYPKMLSNIQEVRARGAEVIAVATEGDDQVAGDRRPRARGAGDARAARTRGGHGPAAALRLSRREAPRLRRRPAPEPREERHGRVGVPGLADLTPGGRHRDRCRGRAVRVVAVRRAYRPRRCDVDASRSLSVEIVGLGVDICEIARMERALARHPTMRARVFTPEEIAYCDSQGSAGRVLRGPVRRP